MLCGREQLKKSASFWREGCNTRTPSGKKTERYYAPPSSSTSLLLYFPARAPQPSPEVRDRDRGDQRVERLGAVTQSMHSA